MKYSLSRQTLRRITFVRSVAGMRRQTLGDYRVYVLSHDEYAAGVVFFQSTVCRRHTAFITIIVMRRRFSCPSTSLTSTFLLCERGPVVG